MEDYNELDCYGTNLEYAPIRGAEFFNWMGFAIGRSTKLKELVMSVCEGKVCRDTGFVFTPGGTSKKSEWHGLEIGNSSVFKELLFSWYDVFNNHIGILCEGVRHNTSLEKITFKNLKGDEILHTMDGFFQANENLADISLEGCDLGKEGCRLLSRAIANTKALKRFKLSFDEGLQFSDDKFVEDTAEALCLHPGLGGLKMAGLTVGRGGCRAMAGFVHWAANDMQTANFGFHRTGDGNESISLSISFYGNGLMRDISFQFKLAPGCDIKELDLNRNRITPEGWAALSRMLCDRSGVNETFLSNHTLKTLYCNGLPVEHVPNDIPQYLRLNSVANRNEVANRKEVAIIKILKYHPDFDADVSSLCTRGFKLLPRVVRWYDRASVCPKQQGKIEVNVELRKLSTIYQFIRGLPLLYIEARTLRKKRGLIIKSC